MKLKKAIEILEDDRLPPERRHTSTFRAALQLGIEALKRCQLARKETSFVGPGLLLGETEET